MATDSNDGAKRGSERKAAHPSGLFESELAGSVRESAQQIWLAGMGAFAKAQAEGKSVFEALVKEGTSLQQKTQAAAEEHFGDVAGKMSSVASEVQAKAGLQWGKLETLFEERTAKALQKLGVPSSKDMQAMQERIDALAARMAADRSSSKPVTKQSTAETNAPQRAAPRQKAAKTTGASKGVAKHATAARVTAKTRTARAVPSSKVR